jgi:nitrogen fixation/metabolism regulation signal transduction histidine kinase
VAWPAGGGLAAGDAFRVLAAVLILAAVGILFLTTFLNYRAITHTFERVKSLMRNVLQSIPTGVLTFDSRGVVTSLNNAAERLLGLRASAVVGSRTRCRQPQNCSFGSEGRFEASDCSRRRTFR